MYFVALDKYLKEDWIPTYEKEFNNKENALKYIENELEENPFLECFLLNQKKELLEIMHNSEYWEDFFLNHIKKYYVLFLELDTGIILNTNKERFLLENGNEYDYLIFDSLKEAVLFCKKESNYCSNIAYLISNKKRNSNIIESEDLFCIFSRYPTIEESERKRILAEKEKKEKSILTKIKRFLARE